jgi:hypothetical protein
MRPSKMRTMSFTPARASFFGIAIGPLADSALLAANAATRGTYPPTHLNWSCGTTCGSVAIRLAFLGTATL